MHLAPELFVAQPAPLLVLGEKCRQRGSRLTRHPTAPPPRHVPDGQQCPIAGRSPREFARSRLPARRHRRSAAGSPPSVPFWAVSLAQWPRWGAWPRPPTRRSSRPGTAGRWCRTTSPASPRGSREHACLTTSRKPLSRRSSRPTGLGLRWGWVAKATFATLKVAKVAFATPPARPGTRLQDNEVREGPFTAPGARKGAFTYSSGQVHDTEPVKPVVSGKDG
ncbi:hypothetical protein SAMN04489729_0144 [Amycolatopsis lurida]|nr:hypothetical protein SAMN04489729_0144 [Amycolatopsis lurida]